MGKKILLAAAVVIGLCILLVHTGQWDSVVGSLSPWAKKGGDAIASGVHSAAPNAPTALPTSVSEGQRQVNDALQHAGLSRTKADARTPSTAVGVLDKLEETTEQPATPYQRSKFGPAWTDAAAGRCDVRNIALSRNLTNVTHARGSTCVVDSGTLTDPYTGKKVTYDRAHPDKVTLDAVAPLSWAWENGADTWSDAKRAKFAADQKNLTVTTAGATDGKDGDGPSRWNPADRNYLCTYVTRFVYIVNDYDLTIDASDKAVIRRDLAMC